MANNGTTGISDALYQAALMRMNYTWDIDQRTERNIRNALEEAQDYLRGEAGNDELSFESGSNRSLLIDCAWYIINHKKAEFSAEYSAELTALRLREGFGCGKDQNTV